MTHGTASATQDRFGKAESAGSAEYLTFRLGAEEYALDIRKVQEIRRYETATAIAKAPVHVKGVVNLRGVIVPVVDLRILLGLPSVEYTAFTAVIVLNFGERTVGLVVDAVSDVTKLDPAQIRPAPDLPGTLDTRYILGIGTIDSRMLILPDIERLLAGDEESPALQQAPSYSELS